MRRFGRDAASAERRDRERVFFGQLLGMADHLTFALGRGGYKAYKYVPYGPLDRALPYLVRRAQEIFRRHDRDGNGLMSFDELDFLAPYVTTVGARPRRARARAIPRSASRVPPCTSSTTSGARPWSARRSAGSNRLVRENPAPPMTVIARVARGASNASLRCAAHS